MMNGKIYVIKSHQTDDVYIGSTTNPLNCRLSKHKRHYKAFLNEKYHYVTSFDIVKYDDCYIELLEDVTCQDKAELYRIEGRYIKEIKCVNKLIAGRTMTEYYNDNKDKIKEYQRQYRIKNKDKINEKRGEKHNCECGVKYTLRNKARHIKSKKHQSYISK